MHAPLYRSTVDVLTSGRALVLSRATETGIQVHLFPRLHGVTKNHSPHNAASTDRNITCVTEENDQRIPQQSAHLAQTLPGGARMLELIIGNG